MKELLETWLEHVTRASKNLGLEINMNKTKLMTIERGNLLPQNNPLNIEEVNEFVYFGSLITNQGDCGKEIKRRISMAPIAMTKLNKIWKDRQITKDEIEQKIDFLYGDFSPFNYIKSSALN